MAHPNERERGKCGIFEKCLHLISVPGLRSSSGLSFGQRFQDRSFFFVAQEFGVGVWEVWDPEEGEDTEEDGRGAFDDENPAIRRCD